MRIVEPQHLKSPTTKSKKNARFRLRPMLLVVVLAGGLGVGWYLMSSKNPADFMLMNEEPSSKPSSTENQQPENQNKTGFRQFSGNDFRLLYDNLRQPNTDRFDVPPPISGNDIADARIRQIAEARGYKLRSSSSVTLPLVDGYPLQEVVRESWRNLKEAASQDGLSISIVSAYRSVANQRQLFLNRLSAEGVNIADVEAGRADEAIDQVLVTSSIPGYSKHHTGYTIDIQCAGYAFENFKNSPCNTWITADNYKNAKQYGFIPSYPEDADLQGPEPEAWEYVWVGTDLLRH